MVGKREKCRHTFDKDNKRPLYKERGKCIPSWDIYSSALDNMRSNFVLGCKFNGPFIDICFDNQVSENMISRVV